LCKRAKAGLLIDSLNYLVALVIVDQKRGGAM
jgi:hypothetical protein